MEDETKQAVKLLQAQRALERDDQKLRWIRNRFSSPAGTEFTYQEVNKVLAEVVENDGSLGVVKGLLALGADVNFVRRRNSGAWNKISQRHQQTERSNILLRATIRCRPETVHALAAHADQESLDSVLHHAIARGNLAVLRTLLDHGASPVYLHDDFQKAVFCDNVELVQVLLSGHHLPCLACRSTGLRLAVNNCSLEVLRLLLTHWGDVNYNSAVALLQAVEIARPDIVTTLISASVRPSPRSLDAAVGQVQPLLEKRDVAGYQILGLCLSTGADGPETTSLITEGLVEIVKSRNTQLLDIILQHRTIPVDYEGQVLVEAVRAEQIDIISKLLEYQPAASNLTMAVSQALMINNETLRYSITSLLVHAGAQGVYVAEALVSIVHSLVSGYRQNDPASTRKDRQLFELLLHEGNADIDFQRGEALQVAIRSSCIDIAECIIAKEPSSESLGAALPWALEIVDCAEKYSMVESLLRRPIDEDASGKALVRVFQEEPANTDLIRLLLTRASTNYNNGEVFVYAVRNFRPDTFHLLLSQGMSYKSLYTVLMEALQTQGAHRRMLLGELLGRFQLDHLNMALKHVVLEPNPDLTLLKTILDAGAEATYEQGVCIRHAACTFSRDVLRLLADYSDPNKDIFTKAFSAIVTRDQRWIAYEHVEPVRILLQHGASSQAASRAVVEVVDYLACKEDDISLAKVLLDNLLAAGADVNFENGKAIGMAASRGDTVLLSFLLNKGATSGSTTLALSAAILAHHQEDLLLELIDVLAQPRSVTTDFNRSLPGMPQPPIILVLKAYGKSVALVKRLVKAGCRLDSNVSMQICRSSAMGGGDSNAVVGTESASVLMWALSQEEELVSLVVIEALIRCGADISYVSPDSRTTPLLVAAQSGRADAVQLLLESGAKVSNKDMLGRSALFFAAQSGNVALLNILLPQKPTINDGSLHEAARGFHSDALKLLLEAGHDANYRSSRHGGRTALGEIARMAQVPHDLASAEETLDILVSAGASPLLKVHDKTVIFLALDNPKNEAIIRLLLDRVLYNTLNSHENMYQQGFYHYSPTMYVVKGMLLGPPSDRLLQILKEHGAEDRFYATIQETQPLDAVGLPEEICEYERERRAWEQRARREEELHNRELRRVAEKAQNLAQIEDQTHTRSVRHLDERSQQLRKHRGLDHHQEILLRAEKHHNDANIRISDANTNSSIRWQQHNDHLAMLAQKRDASMVHRQRVHVQHIEERRTKAQVNDELRELRHVKSLAQMQNVHQQRWTERDQSNRQQLEFESQRKAQKWEHIQRKKQLEREYLHEGARLAAERQMQARALAQEAHGLNMTELKTQRGNIIGQVNLEELRRWQKEKGIMLPGPERRLLTEVRGIRVD
ncbi:hypothetical protein QBC35DRAFT_385918 [Podospora australis]|uniref:Uncharacterized protein n=1 Tax=Podospora australis TaxID=1536484 RepID=A0AAN7AH38_9PEZI|nr:hypothetical protein QBC35DRAFT_385918 [Podospora australis]